MKSKEYLRWVSEQQCCLCGTTPCQAHHLKHLGGFSGTGMKAPDWMAMSLCAEHHAQMHQDPDWWVDQYPYLLRTLLLAFEAGIIRIDEDVLNETR